MKKLLLISTLCALVLGSCNKYSIPQSIKAPPPAFTEYPNWYVPQVQLKNLALPGEEYKWYMSYKGSKEKERFPDSALLAIPATKGEALRIEVKSKRGDPAIAVFDRLLHANDLYALINPYEEAMQIPGSPIAYAVGSNGKADLCYTPGSNTVHTAFIWLLNGDVVEEEPFSREDYELPEDWEDSPFGDGAFFGLDEETIELMIMLDSLYSLDEFRNPWENITSDKEDFKRSKVDVKIEVGNCTEQSASDYYYELYKDYDIARNPGMTVMQTKEDVEDWYAILATHDSLHSLALEQARDWKRQEASFEEDPFGLSPKESLLRFCEDPMLQAALLKRIKYYGHFSEEEDEELLRYYLFGRTRGEFDILLNEHSLMLARRLAGVGAVSGAIYDREGYLLAATQPFTLLNIKESTNWDRIGNSSSGIISSDCYNWKGMESGMQKIFIPIRLSTDSSLIGWLMAEVFCGE